MVSPRRSVAGYHPNSPSAWPGDYCAECGEPIYAGEFFCEECDKEVGEDEDDDPQ